MNVNKILHWWGSGGGRSPEELGVLFDKSSFPDIDDYTDFGTATTSIVSNELNISGTGTFSKGIYNDYGYTLLLDFYRKLTFRINTIIATERGIVVGQKDVALGAKEIWAGLDVTSGANRGKCYIWDDAATVLAGPSTALTINVNDVIQYEFERTGWSYELTVTNITTPNSVSVTYNIDPTLNTNIDQYKSVFGISLFGGATTWTVISDYCSSTSWKYPRVCFVGDSKTEGIGVAALTDVYPYLLFSASSQKYTVCAKGNQTTQDILDAMPEIISIAPTKYVLFIGCNDIRTGVALATWQANFASIVSQLAATGAQVIICRPSKEIGLDLSTLDTYIQTYSPTYTVVDLYSGWNTGTMLAADNIHPNSVGQAYIQTQLSSYAP